MKVDVEGRSLELSSLDRVLWPATGTTKAELVRYVMDVGDVVLPHLVGHPLTLHRFPSGVGGPHFFQTRAPSHPEWVRAVRLRSPNDKVFDVVVLDDVASLVWAANISAIELHPYLGTAEDFDRPTSVVFDLDPGPPANLVDCCDVAVALRDVLADLDLVAWPKVSGGKGVHLHVPIDGAGGFAATKPFARAVAELVARRFPTKVVTTVAQDQRRGRVFIDWSQNSPWKSTIAPYSLRGLTYPTVAAPVSWAEVDAAVETRDPRPLVFFPADIPGRLEHHGDLFAEVVSVRQALPDAA